MISSSRTDLLTAVVAVEGGVSEAVALPVDEEQPVGPEGAEVLQEAHSVAPVGAVSEAPQGEISVETLVGLSEVLLSLEDEEDSEALQTGADLLPRSKPEEFQNLLSLIWNSV